MRNIKVFFLLLLSIILILFSFTSCNTPQITDISETTTQLTTKAEVETTAIETETTTAITIVETTTETAKENVAETTQATEEIKETTAETVSDTTKLPLKIHYIDVGQGDSILIQTPEGNTMLIDGGPASSASNLVSYIKKQGVTKINVIVATHPHEDHIGGLISVLNSFEVDNIIDSGVSHTTQIYKNYLSAIQSKNINFVNWNLGQQFEIGQGAIFKIIGPLTKSSSDLNNSSIVIYLTYNNSSFLFTGDAESTEEGEIISSGENLKADVLKVGHHGSSSSSSLKFLKAVSPTIAIISCGAGNSYGHPHDITLKNLTDIGPVIYRTDLTGTVVIECDGKSVTVVSGKLYTYTEIKATETTQVTETTQPTETAVTETTEQQPSQTGTYVGSIKSDVFHYPSCSYVKKIKPENIIWFSSRDDAIAHGYRPCKVCNP
jgi:competence protein ComEC